MASDVEKYKLPLCFSEKMKIDSAIDSLDKSGKIVDFEVYKILLSKQKSLRWDCIRFISAQRGTGGNSPTSMAMRT